MRWIAMLLILAGCGGDGLASIDDASEVVRVESQAGGFALDVRTAPASLPLNEAFEVRFVLLDDHGEPWTVALDEIRVDADMPEHGHGMNVVPSLAQDGPEVVARPMEFMMPGRWEIYVDVTHGAITERAQWEVVVE